MNDDTVQDCLGTSRHVYRVAALAPDVGACCTTMPAWRPSALSFDLVSRRRRLLPKR